MRVRRVFIRGINRTTEAEVDLEALGPGLVALVGPNGAGKTTFMETPHAARYLGFPSRRGSLTDRARGRDSLIEVDYLAGPPGTPESVRAVVSIDAIARKVEPCLLKSSGEPFEECRNKLVRPYGEIVNRLFGSEALSLSACLCAQDKSGSFAVLPKAERKDLVLEVLDTTGCQVLSERAKAKKDQAERDLAKLQAEMDTLAKEADSITVTQETLARLEEEIRDAKLALLALENQEPAARDRVVAASAALEVARKRASELSALQAEARDLQGAVSKLEQAEQAMRLQAKQEVARAFSNSREQRILQAIEDQKKTLAKSLEGLDEKILESEMEAGRLEEYRQAEHDAAHLEERIHALEAEREALQTERDGHQAQLHEAIQKQANIEALSRSLADARSAVSIIGKVPFGDRCSASGCLFLVGANSQLLRIPGLEAEIAGLGPLPDIDGIRSSIASADQALSCKRGEILVFRADLSAKEQLARRKASAENASRVIGEANASKQLARENCQKVIEDLQLQFTEEKNRVASEAQAIEERRDKAVQEASLKLLDARRRLFAISQQVAESDASGINGFEAEVRTARAAEEALQQSIGAARRSLSTAETTLALAEQSMERSKTIHAGILDRKARAGEAARDGADWAFLEKAYGRDGIQALELDAAGPGLSELVNDLLTSCYGNRFEVRFITQVPKKDGKGSKEIFDLEVTDHEEGRVGTLDDLSGGEKVPIGEAVSLALAIYAGRHSGHHFETLFRDETVGACDPQNANQYVAMLRRALLVGGFYQIVFIAQQEQVWRQADVILRFENGTVEVENGAIAR